MTDTGSETKAKSVRKHGKKAACTRKTKVQAAF